MANDSIRNRTLFALSLFAGGFVFPLLWLVAAIVAFTIYAEIANPAKPASSHALPTKPTPAGWNITADDPDWKDRFLALCESPAETAFLTAMVDAHGLAPSDGVLKGGGIKFDLQVRVPPYRLDFLVDGWLCVEIDGAEWHSAPEQVERDRIRDEYLVEKGYTVLRIPARVVFRMPLEAVNRVRRAHAVGRPASVVDEPVPSKQPPAPTGGILSSTSRFLDELNRSVAVARERQKATAEARSSVSVQRILIEGAVDLAVHSVELDEKLAANPKFAEIYNQMRANLDDSLAKQGQASASETQRIVIPVLTMPEKHPDAAIDALIQADYRTILAERSEVIKAARAKMASNPEVAKRVCANLRKQEHSELADALT